MPRILADAAAEVTRRVEQDEYTAARRIIVINALHRARDLSAESSYDGTEPQQNLLTILRDGADVGIHVIVTADSVDTVERRIGRTGLAEFGARLVGQCSADASQRLVGSSAATRLGSTYALLHEPDDDRIETIRPFPLPAESWLAAAAMPGTS